MIPSPDTPFVVRKGVKRARFLRLALSGPAGSNRLYSALRVATCMRDYLPNLWGRPIVVLDTERDSAGSLVETEGFDFDVVSLPPPYHPNRYGQALEAIAVSCPAIVIIHSLSQAWAAEGGIMESVDKLAMGDKGDGRAGWRVNTPIQTRFISSLMGLPFHLITTLRARSKRIVTGEGQVLNVGMEPIQSQGIDHEFDHFVELSPDSVSFVRTLCRPLCARSDLQDDAIHTLADWLGGSTAAGAVAAEADWGQQWITVSEVMQCLPKQEAVRGSWITRAYARAHENGWERESVDSVVQDRLGCTLEDLSPTAIAAVVRVFSSIPKEDEPDAAEEGVAEDGGEKEEGVAA